MTNPAPSAGADAVGDREAQDELGSKLAELRKIPGFPKATDEAVLRMSVPKSYTACPNPFISEWLEQSKPDGYDSESYEDPGPFTSDVSVGKTHPFYKAHSYPTKVPHEAIVRYILHYTRPGDVVLDGFCGTGMTGVAAQVCGQPSTELMREIEIELGGKVRWGARRAVLQDLSPSATFIAAGMNLPIDADAFDRRSSEILERFDADWGWMYRTQHKGQPARIDYTVWSEVFSCKSCGEPVVFYEAAFDEKTGKMLDDFKCPSCGAPSSKRTLERRKVKVRTLAGDTIDRIEFRPVRIHYRYGGRRYDKQPGDDDLAVLRRIGLVQVPRFATDRIPLEHMYHGSRLGPKGFTHIHHLFSDRALASLAVLWHWCSSEDDPALRLALLFWVEQAIWGLSWMNRYRPEGFSQVSQYQPGVYYAAALHSECSVNYNVTGKRENLVKVWKGLPSTGNRSIISTASSTHLGLPDSSVDYVFVDPPFGENIYYADLGCLVESWHGVVEDPGEEAIIDRHKQRPKALPEYQELMESCFREFHRTLKPGRWMTVEFNNSANEVWLGLQHAISAAGLVVTDVRTFDKEQKSYRQVTASNAVKNDLIISAYKPAAKLEQEFKVVAGSEEGVWRFVREHLSHLPIINGKRGQAQAIRERMADRLYERMVAYHLSKGVNHPLSAAEFYAGLDLHFPVRDQMYFLPDQVETYERHRMTIKDLAQAEFIILGEPSAIAWLRQRLKARPQAYDEIHSDYFRELQTRPRDWEDLPELRVLLEQNFLQDEKDRWYVPDPRKASDLAKVRTRDLLREFATYAESKGRLARFRAEAVHAGFKDAWAHRDFDVIVSVGARLPQQAYERDEQLLFYYDNARKLRG